MNDRQRGTVWEESIIYCPAEIQLVALSATIANSNQLTDWLNLGPTELIYSNFRPVPLEFYFCNPKGYFPHLTTTPPKLTPSQTQARKQRVVVPGQSSLVCLTQLTSRDMLPAIYFIFSRRGCDKAVADLGSVSLVNEAEQSSCGGRLTILRRKSRSRPLWTNFPLPWYCCPSRRGCCLLGRDWWKNIQQGLIKVVFATETWQLELICLPETVISSKRTDRGHRLLNASEFLQMAGQAGRRGMDKRGYVVTLQTPFEGAKDTANLATAGADPLRSQFTPSYGMVLNLLQTHTLEQAKSWWNAALVSVERLKLKPQYRSAQGTSSTTSPNPEQLAYVDIRQLDSMKLRQRLKVERQLVKICKTKPSQYGLSN